MCEITSKLASNTLKLATWSNINWINTNNTIVKQANSWCLFFCKHLAIFMPVLTCPVSYFCTWFILYLLGQFRVRTQHCCWAATQCCHTLLWCMCYRVHEHVSVCKCFWLHVCGNLKDSKRERELTIKEDSRVWLAGLPNRVQINHRMNF